MSPIPESVRVNHMILPGVTDGAARTSATICLKNVRRAWIVCSSSGGAAAIVTWSLFQATDIASATNKAVANAVPIWHCASTAVSDLFVKQTAGVLFATAAAAVPNLTVFEVDPSQLDVANGYDCLYVTTLGANAGNLLCVLALCEMRYQDSDGGPTIIVD
ncbi:MAG: hypothetical protein FJX72_10670 [Armatimonadetes bacterium]|nr:hypothetical protein [Armatimonadota bacterium]